MLEELKKSSDLTRTENDAVAYRSTGSCCLDLFAVCSALRGRDEGTIIQKFARAYAESPDTAMRILFYARDVREGLGERRFFRVALRYLADHRPSSVIKICRLSQDSADTMTCSSCLVQNVRMRRSDTYVKLSLATLPPSRRGGKCHCLRNGCPR